MDKNTAKVIAQRDYANVGAIRTENGELIEYDDPRFREVFAATILEEWA